MPANNTGFPDFLSLGTKCQSINPPTEATPVLGTLIYVQRLFMSSFLQ